MSFSFANASEFIADCELTPALPPNNVFFGKYSSGNNLRHISGSYNKALGDKLEIRGKIVDKNCLPIVNARVYLWQVDRFGRYREYYEQASIWDDIGKEFDENFAFSGTAYTNNIGEFVFYTIMPGRYLDSAPHVNLVVAHKDFEELITRMYLQDSKDNDTDYGLKSLSKKERFFLMAKGKKIDGQYIYRHIITLDGINHYRKF